jgi:hypothetical protein
VGNWKNDVADGKGIMHKGATLTEGTWEKGKTNGWGRMLFQSGSCQMGYMVNDLLHGYGRVLSKDAGLSEGNWSNGVLQGFGIQLYRNGDFFVGQYDQGKKNGIGIYFYGKLGFYIGQYQNDMKSGYGYLVDKDDCYYTGSWLSDKKNGRGFEHYLDGSKYSGFFKDGRRQGGGIMIYSDYQTKGTWDEMNSLPKDPKSKTVKYIGHWHAGLKEGSGRLEKQGKFVTGFFKKDEFVNPGDISLRKLLKDLESQTVPDNFKHWLDSNPSEKKKWESMFHLPDSDLITADRYVYPSLLRQA